MIYEVLNQLNIPYEEMKHIPVYTVEEAESLHLTIDGVGCKNLFLKNEKGSYYLVFMADDKRADLKKIAESVDCKKVRFAGTDELMNILHLEKGSVTPLGIIHDKERQVFLVIDAELVGSKVLMHPLRNDRTISIGFDDFLKFIEFTNHEYSIMKM
ncbi:MAG: prolyl-tRNA synthetase associated domain-containing protein [Bacilli bacterium]|nr:prolyl-tRNA synthetase associated domain-containing protein [Bacilli bacterium]